MALFCCRIAYDGTAYHGFQYQAGVPTIQGVLEERLDQFVLDWGRVAGAGRTDTGVHAQGQVIAVDAVWQHDAGALQEAWNAHLPADIHLRQMCRAPQGFHPRFDALSRTYRYNVVNYAGSDRPNPRRSPLTDRFAFFEPALLDLAAMNRAAQFLVGEHDFTAFGWPTAGESTVRCVEHAEWVEDVQGAESGLALYPARQFRFTITANGFLRRMVRLVTGMLLDVGRGWRTVDSVALALTLRDRRLASRPAPAHGLVLERVTYPADLSPW